MNLDDMAARLAELGHPTRLQILKHLMKAGYSGTPVGDIQAALDVPGSTLSHHLSRMMKVGLIRQERESRTLYCFSNYDAINEVINYLMDECCVNDERCG
ncbi:ArsR/SmtB family transcription factor [Reinekea blandensis]|uniref:HTH arsR-type domain-containing protein n=1 Tax=Reinekea blandensis MED297 TaxID=314283 RepID=A4BJZ8_9GAMM|nr:metalloregulator ArsR/SmtB family transcription factor [Reinekea blandensis]EAR07531.1 hypothetical protein MED297_04664 [Reinekea sp. MED297] [Reinekea blandensis MED297]